MRRVGDLVAGAGFLTLALSVAACRFGAPPPMADVGATIIAASADIQTTPRRVEEFLVTFRRADEALKQQDLDTLMKIYSKNYNYHGIDKAELRNIWQDLFRQYRDFSNTHVFSKIVVDEKKTLLTAEITCTGSIWAVSRITSKRVNIDSWYGDVHDLVYEDGAWRITGHAWEALRDTRYVLNPHPFF